MDLLTDYSADQSRERQLWCAVIARAVRDALWPAGPLSVSREQARDQAEARRWFLENDPDYRRVCESAGFDPDYLRDRVISLGLGAEPQTVFPAHAVESAALGER